MEKRRDGLPTQHTQNEIHHEEGAYYDKTDEIKEWPFHSLRIIHLERKGMMKQYIVVVFIDLLKSLDL